MMDSFEKLREDCMPFPSLEALDEEPPRCFYDASLLFRRMALNQIDQAEIVENDPLLFYELQGLCALCRSKEQCAGDLVNEADNDSSDGWREYCPNAMAFSALEIKQNCGLAAQHCAGYERIVVTKLGSVILRTAKDK
jgi:hypothetical protein